MPRVLFQHYIQNFVHFQDSPINKYYIMFMWSENK